MMLSFWIGLGASFIVMAALAVLLVRGASRGSRNSL